MFIDPLDIPIHRVIGNEVDFISPLGKIFRPALGMDAAAIGDEAENHRIISIQWNVCRIPALILQTHVQAHHPESR